MALLPFDAIEQILVRLDVEDLIRFKSVCKSWYSLISSPPFVQAHLNHNHNTDRDNPELAHRRIGNNIYDGEEYSLSGNELHVVGSCNGLVCVSPKDVEFVVTNPCTRVDKKLHAPPFLPHTHKPGKPREVVCWGFGYDSSIDDYKVVVGFMESVDQYQTLFYVLTLKSNVWTYIGEVKYRCFEKVTGTLCGRALHWFMSDATKKVLISLDLSTQEIREVTQPTNKGYQGHKIHKDYALGIIEECLCIYRFVSGRFKRWVLRNNKWEPRNGQWGNKYDLVHSVVESQTTYYTHDDGRSPSNYVYMCASIFVKSLVSPHPYVSNNDNYYYEGRKRNTMQEKVCNEDVQSGVKFNIRKRKRSCKA